MRLLRNGVNTGFMWNDFIKILMKNDVMEIVRRDCVITTLKRDAVIMRLMSTSYSFWYCHFIHGHMSSQGL